MKSKTYKFIVDVPNQNRSCLGSGKRFDFISTLDENVKVSDKAIGIEGSSIYLTKGENLSMRQLLYALLLQSANDAATAIAIEVSGSIEEFAKLMNDKAKDMGLCNSNFTRFTYIFQ